MTGAIDEAVFVSMGFGGRIWRLRNLRDVSQQSIGSAAALSLAGRVDLLLALVTSVASWPRALLVVALVDLGVGVTQLDGNVSDQLVLESNRLDAGDGLDDGGLSVSHVADGADVDSRLSGNDLGRQGSEGSDIEVLGVGLGGR